jgi:hypothetical protein
MPLQKLQFSPGVNRESTTTSNEGTWFDVDKVRFRSGYPEKIGGWIKDSGTQVTGLQPPTGSYWGVARSLWNWVNLSGYNLLGVGTDMKYYIQNTIGGAFNDITPLKETTLAGAVTFAATNGSNVITVTDTGSNTQQGDFVTFSGAVSLGGNITAAILNAEHRVSETVSSGVYKIQVSATANSSDVGDGGAGSLGRSIKILGDSFAALFKAFSEDGDKTTDGMQELATALNNVAGGINAIATAYSKAKSALNFIDRSGGFEFFGGFKGLPIPFSGNALGGTVRAGVPTRVGEMGSEVFIPSTNGQIIPNNRLGGGGNTFVFNGVIDGESARRSIERLLQSSARRTGAVNFAGANL